MKYIKSSKKLLAVILSVMLGSTMAACSNNTESTKSLESTTAASSQTASTEASTTEAETVKQLSESDITINET
ncbi:MAG: hypothetical protein IJ725_05795, partial [Ruminococcus sp.]|nr:hypothetical protein [Ruminococcus sp.]